MGSWRTNYEERQGEIHNIQGMCKVWREGQLPQVVNQMSCCIVEAHGYDCCCEGHDWIIEHHNNGVGHHWIEIECAFCGIAPSDDEAEQLVEYDDEPVRD